MAIKARSRRPRSKRRAFWRSSPPRVTAGAVVTVRLARDVRLEIADVAAVSTDWVAELAMRLSRDL